MAQPCRAGRVTPCKRLFDVALALGGLALLLLPMALVALLLLAAQGLPVLHGSERMRTPDRAFRLWKFRSMTVTAADSGVTGGDKAARITPAGRILRRTRIDEWPQLWNIVRGDMSLVGPRPPLRSHVERCPGLYARVLQSRPGLTGLATLHFHRHEAWLLAGCDTPEATDRLYIRRCIPRKARLDLIYQRRRTLWLDLTLLAATLRCLGGRPTRRRHP